jgi:YD repeat-containing protein
MFVKNSILHIGISLLLGSYASVSLAQAQSPTTSKAVQVIKGVDGQVTAVCKTDKASTASSSYVCGSSSTVPSGVTQWIYTYCTQGQQTAGTCSSAGLVLTKQKFDAKSAKPTTYSYYPLTDTSGCSTTDGPCHVAGQLWKVQQGNKSIVYVKYQQTSQGNNSNVTQLKNLKGDVYELSYNAQGKLETWTARTNKDGSPSTSDVVTTLKYNGNNDVSNITTSTGLRIDLTYDSANKLASIDGLPGNQAQSAPAMTSQGAGTQSAFANAVSLERHRFINLSRMMGYSYKYSPAVTGLTKLESQLSTPVF